ncbi:malate synthase [Thermosporothrix hazakensis]|jgi:malate synthase|uniref:Malate synthase n=2 Tax=Thermosporothrix TaxID=768650 RepID=A0A326UG21_THEHA|nr:malate synthase A [Thermosporothrix hazakensis]PZW36721.1 malate synthase [Thermosporothrix hazakensis]BBH89190.1 malate synthase [Thermosporothrix sp. COM3]GCE47372.1 malate synthase [Thermosporothrix hazakensis]
MTSQETVRFPAGIEITAPISPAFAEILTPAAMEFVALLCRTFEGRRADLLQRRAARQAEIDAGTLPDFLPETAHIRQGNWTIAPLPADLQDRRVEITGPVDRKMIINALNSGAKVFMADFEDAHSPTWAGTIEGQINVRDAVRRTISYTSPEGKHYQLNEQTAVLLVRPRGWHLDEKHVLLDGKPISGGIFDFALYFFHNAHALLERGTGPYFYLPKLESHLEARLWNDIFSKAQQELGIPQGTIKATVLIETILATFEMDEILYELREHSAGLNCGRWDYIFSAIKKFRNHPDFLYPDRAQVTMTTHFMRSYTLLTIKTCHRRNAPAIGGMAAQIPIKHDPQANEEALARVREDKRREATDGHDGTWVAHPGLVSIARAEFDAVLKGPNQIERKREDVQVTAADLLKVPEGTITEGGVRNNISVSLQYLESWLRGTGCVPINNLMEDAATVEISRAQLWQWLHHPRGILGDGRKVTVELFHSFLDEELARLKALRAGRFEDAARILDELVTSATFVEFLTLPAYRYLA